MKGVISGYAWLLMLAGLTFGSFALIAVLGADPHYRHNEPDSYSFYIVMTLAGFMTAVAGGLWARSDLRRHKPSMRPVEMIVLGFGLIPLSGFFLVIGWALADSITYDEPPVCLMALAGLVTLVVGISLIVMGIVRAEEEDSLVPAQKPPN